MTELLFEEPFPVPDEPQEGSDAPCPGGVFMVGNGDLWPEVGTGASGGGDEGEGDERAGHPGTIGKTIEFTTVTKEDTTGDNENEQPEASNVEEVFDSDVMVIEKSGEREPNQSSDERPIQAGGK